MGRRSAIRWYEGAPFYIEPPFPWLAATIILLAVVIGFLSGLLVMALVLP